MSSGAASDISGVHVTDDGDRVILKILDQNGIWVVYKVTPFLANFIGADLVETAKKLDQHRGD